MIPAVHWEIYRVLHDLYSKYCLEYNAFFCILPAVLSRRLLQEGGGGGGGGGEGEDGSVYVNEGEPVQLDENGEVELGDNDDPYDKEGNIRKNTCMPPAIKQVY